MGKLQLASTDEIRNMTYQVLFVEQEGCWPGDGEVPKWVRELGAELGCTQGIFEIVPKVCHAVSTEVMRRVIFEPERIVPR